MKGIKLQKGPMPRNFAIMGDTTATASPDEKLQVITDTIKMRFTTEPVIKVFPKDALTA